MLPATFCAGMTLPLITYRLLRSPTGERALGLVYAVNTLGAILGVVITVHFLLEWLGLRGALVVGAAIDVGLGVVLLAVSRRGLRRRSSGREAIAGIVALVLLAIAVRRGSATLVLRRLPDGRRPGSARTIRIVFHRDGKTATVDVLENQGTAVDQDQRQVRREPRDGRPAGGRPATNSRWRSSASCRWDIGPRRRPRRSWASGPACRPRFCSARPRIERVDSIEIEPAMVEGREVLPARRGRGLPRPAQPHRDRRREVVLRARRRPLRHHRVGAVQSLGERRGLALHRGVLRAPGAAPERRRRAVAVAAYLRDGRARPSPSIIQAVSRDLSRSS